MEVLISQGWPVTGNKYALESYPCSPYEYLRKWVGKSFEFSDESGAKTFFVKSVSTSCKNPVYIIKGPSGNARAVSEREFHTMVFDLPVP